MKKIVFLIITISLCLHWVESSGQNTEYYPNGDPDKWKFEITPFLWLPMFSGEIESPYLSESFSVPAVDILSNMKGAFMINAEISKGKVFASPSYIYTKVGTDRVVKTNNAGEEIISASPELSINIAGLIVGIHEVVSKKFIIDPYIGFRYNSFKTGIEIQGIRDTNSVEETANFIDPVMGLRLLYFPHPRVPLMFKSDVGGFGIGSDYSWTATINGGYTISPQLDLFAGITAYGMNFTGEAKTGSTTGLKMAMYGFNVGVKIILPKRAKDPKVFKKFRD